MSLLHRRPTVLMYHGFRTDPDAADPYDLAVLDTSLDEQLRWLRDHSWTPLDLDGYLAALDGRGPRGRSFLVTIDDALRSVLTTGAPLLQAAGIPSVLFVPPALVGSTTTWLDQTPNEPLLTPDELRTVAGMGVEMGVHGWDHETMKGMSDEGLRRSTAEARDAVADLTGVRPRSFAYPYGDYDQRAIDAVATAGFTVGFSVYEDAGRHAISRTDVKPADSMRTMALKLACGARYRSVWRAVGTVKPLRQQMRKAAQQR